MNPLAITLRTKKLGVLIRDARMSCGKSIEECAGVIECSPAEFEAFELGQDAPSLPQIELLAFSLGIPLDHFWGSTAISEEKKDGNLIDVEQLTGLRQRMIGTLIRKAREDAGLSLQAVSEGVGISPESLEAIEFGRESISLPLLEYLTEFLNCSIKDFQDVHGPVGTWLIQQRAVDDFLELSPELREFVSRPINRPYLELAFRLSEMSVEKLRAVGEGILEITL
jgi:transcriptional regulator with XRE-family HTH domain